MRARLAIRLLLVIIAVVAVQAAVMVNLVVAGAHPEIVWLLPISAALLGGAELGAIVGFVSGISIDCLLITPFGLSAFVGVLIGFFLGQLAERSGLAAEGGVWWLLPALGAGLSALCVLAFDAFGIVLGQDQFTALNLPAIVGVVAISGALLMVPIWMAMSWAIGSRSGARRSRAGEVSW
jgi:cell shape-determining protein MreD